MEDKLVKLYTGNEVIINRLKTVLEKEGIETYIKDRFKEGLHAGFVDGVPSAIEIYVTNSNEKGARKILDAIINNP